MEIEVNAHRREVQGTGASRRLRRDGKVPGILYGGKEPAVNIELDQAALALQLRKEAFHASILTLSLAGQKQQVLLRAVNMHPWRPHIQHIDFQRVLADQKIHMKVPLHFVNAEVSPAVKVSAAIVSHVMNEIDIVCLPADLPEFIEVDLKEIDVGHSIHVKDLLMPKGVEAAVHRGENPVVASATIPRAVAAEEETAAAEAETPAVSAVPAAKQPDKPEEKKSDEKKSDEKKK